MIRIRDTRDKMVQQTKPESDTNNDLMKGVVVKQPNNGDKARRDTLLKFMVALATGNKDLTKYQIEDIADKAHELTEAYYTKLEQLK